MSNKNPLIEWTETSGKECLKFTFEENLTEADAVEAITEWKRCFSEKTDKPLVLIWDCRKMRRYDTAARDRWTEALKEMRKDIESIWLITDNLFIRFGAFIMGTICAIKINVIHSEDEIPYSSSMNRSGN
jgi:hypothetical protein